ncbi:MAG: threonylcarbamoyl-AMP synthase [Chitinophagaceae bacterium]|nr:threonylcarbamoyl-AMP synthase [Chitinophagaceae bacterium]
MVDFENDIKNCVSVVQNGGTVLYPTDTVWGLGCDALNEAAVDKIFELKQRPKEKSLIVLLAEAKDILQYVAAPHPDIIAIVEEFDRPTTIIYENALGFPPNVVNADGSIAIRVTNDPFCKALIKRLKVPLVSTSANISGKPTAPTYNLINDSVKAGVDYVVHYRRDDEAPRQPSRLVKIDDMGEMEILRG